MSRGGLGLLGGTFDPIHLAHLRLAQTARALLSLERVLLIPAGEPPLKPRCVASPEHRARMVELAIAAQPGLEICTIELERTGPSYTVDTLAEMARVHPDQTRWFIVGSDALRGIEAWQQPERLFELASFAVVVRAGDPKPSKLDQLLPHAHAAAFEAAGDEWIHASGQRLRVLPFDPIDVSSTEIRERIRRGDSVRDWLPEPVIDYIHTYGLYEEDT